MQIGKVNTVKEINNLGITREDLELRIISNKAINNAIKASITSAFSKKIELIN
jgi:hypothetical protein